MIKLQPRKVPRQSRSKAMVDTILDAMAQVLVERGYEKANTNLVAEAAGISVGSLYQYFPNKDALIFALRERHVAHMLSIFEAAVQNTDADSTLQNDFEYVIDTLVAAHLLEPELNRILEEEFPAVNLPVANHIRLQFFNTIKGLLLKHRNSISAPDIEMATFVVQRIFRAMIYAVVLEGPAGLDAKAVRSEIVPAIIGYLMMQRKK